MSNTEIIAENLKKNIIIQLPDSLKSILVDKDEFNVSHVRRLADVKGVRREENYFANYNSGRYEAIPEPEMF